MSETSGSRWEPNADEHPTQRLAGAQPTDPDAAPGPAGSSPRRAGRAVATVALVAAATLAGGAVGMAVAGNRTADASDTSDTAVVDGGAPQGFAPGESGPDWDGDDHGFEPGGEHDGFGRH